MPLHHTRRLASAPLLLALAACGDKQSRTEIEQTGGPTLRIVSETSLPELDASPLGTYHRLAYAGVNGFLVSDMQGGRLMRYRLADSSVQSIGRRGSGPGELSSPGGLAVLAGDSLVVASDIGAGKFAVFDLRSSRWLADYKLGIQDVGTSWIARGDTLSFGVGGGSRAIASWRLGDSTLIDRLMTPKTLLEDAYVYLSHGQPEVVPSDSGYLLILPTDAGLHTADAGFRLTSYVPLPRRERKGPTEDMRERAAARRGAKTKKQFEPLGSAVRGLHRLPGGDYLVAMADATQLIEEPKQLGDQIFGDFKTWLSVVRADLSAACVDARLASPSDALPSLAFRGDTVFALMRFVDDTDQPRTTLSAYVVDTADCEWLPTGAPKPPLH